MLLLWVSCAIDPSDCRYFSRDACVPWRPDGLTCGLAHQRVPDPCPGDDTLDTNGDGVPNACQERYTSLGCGPDDEDGDGTHDWCDRCPGAPEEDEDEDGVPDLCDPCPIDRIDDADGDGICTSQDDEADVHPDAHWGGSCRASEDELWFDPALEDPTSGVVRARAETRACPGGYAPGSLSDHEGGDSRWAVCESLGSPGSTRTRSDLPEGAVCGLSRMGGLARPCEGYESTRGQCPPDFELRWVPDDFVDGVDAACRPDSSLALPAFEILTFCVLAGGCLEGDCSEVALDPGVLCGLHARGREGPYIPDPIWLAEPPMRDLNAMLDYLLSDLACPEAQAVLDLEPELRDGASEPVTCMGRPVEQGCPAPLEEVCTLDIFANTDAYAPHLSPRALCWCGSPGSGQGSLPECSSKGSPCVWGQN